MTAMRPVRDRPVKLTEAVIRATATPIFARRIIKMIPGRSFSSSGVSATEAARLLEVVDPVTAVGLSKEKTSAGGGVGAALLLCNQEGLSAMVR